MSVKRTSREITVTRPAIVTVYSCDGPGCKQTFEREEHAGRMMGVPVGWIFVDTVTADSSPGNEVKHYCSRDCLLDSLVP